MVKVDWLLVEVASLTVGGGYVARPLVLCWSLVVGAYRSEPGSRCELR
jgi:hypothetical protein